MFTYMDLYSISSALNEIVFRSKEDFKYWEKRMQEAVERGDSDSITKTMRSLSRCERRIEEHEVLIFKTEAMRRWTEAEKILFPERFTS